MSLNRTEQRVYDYLWRQTEERQYWQHKVQRIAAETGDPVEAAPRLEGELWRYYLERSGVVPEFRDTAGREGLARTSMRNLAEHLLRQWVALKPKPPPPSGPNAG